MDSDADQLVSRTRSKYGDSLRALATYDRESYELHYAGQDVESVYSKSDLDDIYDDVVLQDVEQPFQEQLFEDMGAVRGKLRLFKNGTVAHFWPSEADEGVFFAFDDSADPSVRTLLELAREFYN